MPMYLESADIEKVCIPIEFVAILFSWQFFTVDKMVRSGSCEAANLKKMDWFNTITNSLIA